MLKFLKISVILEPLPRFYLWYEFFLRTKLKNLSQMQFKKRYFKNQ